MGGAGNDGWGLCHIHKRLTQFPIFSSVVTGVCSNRSAAHLPTRQRHSSVATTKTPQSGAQRLCDGDFLWLGEKQEWNQHLMTLSSKQEGLVEQPVGCRRAGPVTSLPQ